MIAVGHDHKESLLDQVLLVPSLLHIQTYIYSYYMALVTLQSHELMQCTHHFTVKITYKFHAESTYNCIIQGSG